VVANEVRELSKRSTSAARRLPENSTLLPIRWRKDGRGTEGAREKHGLGELQQLVHDLTEMQQDFSRSSQLQLDVISDVETGHREGVSHLLAAMGHIQFQDVMRQRMEHVQKALVDMRNHLLRLTETQDRPGWNGLFDTTSRHCWSPSQ